MLLNAAFPPCVSPISENEVVRGMPPHSQVKGTNHGKTSLENRAPMPALQEMGFLTYSTCQESLRRGVSHTHVLTRARNAQGCPLRLSRVWTASRPSRSVWVNELWFSPITEFHLAIKMNQVYVYRHRSDTTEKHVRIHCLWIHTGLKHTSAGTRMAHAKCKG